MAKKEALIRKTLDKSKNVKYLNKKLSLRNYLTIYLENESGVKIYDRDEINQVATKFYEKLYDSEENSTVPPSEPSIQLEELAEFCPFLSSEVEMVVNRLKKEKAPGRDGIRNEHIKAGGRILIEALTITLFNKIMDSNSIPTEWKHSDIILLHKKGSRHKINNYSRISLSPTISKIFSKLLELRLRKTLEFHQPPEQAGIRQNFSTLDHLHTINQIL